MSTLTSPVSKKKHLEGKTTELSLKTIIQLLPSFAFENLVCVLFPGSLDVLHEQSDVTHFTKDKMKLNQFSLRRS